MRLAVIPGDGIGPEVVAEGLKVLRAVAPDVESTPYDLGASRWQRTGELLPDGTYAAYLESTAPAALAAALQAVLADPDAARTRADAAYTNLCAHFTWQAVFATMEKTAAQAAKRS